MKNPDSSETRTISGLRIRPESDSDAGGIQQVLLAAFGGDVEARLVEALRNNGGLVVSLVACASGEIIGVRYRPEFDSFT
jgi:putative acetyltransferase